MPFLKKLFGIMLALGIGVGVLFGLLRFYNKAETKRLTRPAVKLEHLKYGNLSRFPNWNEYAEFPPESIIRYSAVDQGKVLFDVTYEIDYRGLRKEQQEKGPFSAHLFLGGCSFVFGNAVKDGETLSAHARRAARELDVVNLGHGGGGLHTQLRLLELTDLRELAPEKRGAYVYVFFKDHISRWLGAPSYLAWAQDEDVHYEWVNGKLQHGPLKETDKYKVFQKAKASGLDKVYQKAVMRHEYSDEELESFVRGVAELKARYHNAYPEGQFLFAFHPFNDPLLAKRLAPLLDKANVFHRNFMHEFQHFVKKSGLPDANFIVPLDGHPSTAFNEYFSVRLLETLGMKKP